MLSNSRRSYEEIFEAGKACAKSDKENGMNINDMLAVPQATDHPAWRNGYFKIINEYIDETFGESNAENGSCSKEKLA